MTFSAKVAISTEWLDEINEANEFIPVAIDSFARRELRPFASQWIDRTLRQEPGPAKKPIDWETPKQKRWFFWQVSIGAIKVPYVRTHKYSQGWHVIADFANGLTSILIFNDRDAAEFVGGRRQQRQHKRTGWANAANELQQLSIEMDERIETGLPILIDQVLEGRYDAI